VESEWEDAERSLQINQGDKVIPYADFYGDINSLDETSSEDLPVLYTFKNLRFIHAQLSANPPTVIPRPTSNDQDDRRKADAADRVIRYALRHYNLQEYADRVSLHTLIYGTGFLKLHWDGEAGEPVKFIEDTGEIDMSGDFSISTPLTWNIYPDSEANTWSDVRFVFERIYIPFDEAVHKFGEDKREILESNRVSQDSGGQSSTTGRGSTIHDRKYDSVEIYEYWEKGMPLNGFLGRFCYCTREGQLLSPLYPNPLNFRNPGSSEDSPTIAHLPYHIFTDIDMPNIPWGRSALFYAYPLQDAINRIDAATYDAAKAHGVARLILPEGAEVAEDSITNSNWDIIKMTGTQPPHFMEALPLSSVLPQLRDRMKMGVDDMMGVNASMFGEMNRETAGTALQFASQQGSMIRRRLFNKYVMFTESVYKSFLNLVRKHWDIPRTIKVIGKEKVIEAVDIAGADIESGYDLIVEYGASLSLDPSVRREEIMALQPLFEKAQVPTRVILRMLKLNELESLYDILQLAEDRQREIFEEMIANPEDILIEPEEFEDHENMLAYALQYVMTTEFKYLEGNKKELIREHIRLRAEQDAREKMGAQAPGPAGQPGALPQPPEMTGIPAGVAGLSPA